MSDYRLKMPDVGEGVVEAEIVEWKVKVGDVVNEDEDLVDVMTDKATVEIPSPVSGTITALTGDPGDVIPVGAEIVVIATGEGAASDAQPEDAKPEVPPAPAQPPVPPAPAKLAPVSTPPTPPAPVVPMATSVLAPAALNTPGGGGGVLASPAVRQRARDHDVDLATVPGSGPAGRVTNQDLDDFIAAGGRAVVRASAASAGLPNRAPRTGVRDTKIIGLRRKIAENMQKAWDIPHITYAEELDVTDVEALRRHLNDTRRDDQPKLTVLPFLISALVRALADIPQANAHFDSDAGVLREFDGVHVGVATATEKGLMVPVLRHAEALDVWTMAREIGRLAAACRQGAAAREELSGSTITVTSLGAMGGVVTTPILNPPETAIIGVNKMVERPAFDRAGRVVPRLFMTVSSSFDHRIVDGYEAAQLIQRVKQLIENPATVFM